MRGLVKRPFSKLDAGGQRVLCASCNERNALAAPMAASVFKRSRVERASRRAGSQSPRRRRATPRRRRRRPRPGPRGRATAIITMRRPGRISCSKRPMPPNSAGPSDVVEQNNGIGCEPRLDLVVIGDRRIAVVVAVDEDERETTVFFERRRECVLEPAGYHGNPLFTAAGFCGAAVAEEMRPNRRRSASRPGPDAGCCAGQQQRQPL
jgi:hypothetical protein